MAKKGLGRLLPSLNKLRRRVDKVERTAIRQHETFFSGRAGIAKEIRFDVGLWLGLLGLLIVTVIVQNIIFGINIKTTDVSAGGAYAEGIVGEITSFNPLYAESNDEKAVSSLVYSALLKTDETNSIALDLAESWTVSDDGLNYDLKIRDGVVWHGTQTPVTADDVIFTTQLMQDSSVQSPLYDTWKNIQVTKLTDNDIRFTLKTSLVSFPWALNFGILSYDELKDIKRTEIREYLTDHIALGTGPYIFRGTSLSGARNKILFFVPNEKYFGGAPQVEAFHIESYPTSQDMVGGFNKGEINVASGISLEIAQKTTSRNLRATPVDGGVFAVFNTTGDVTNSLAVRQALRLGIDREQVRSAVAVQNKQPNALETPVAPGVFAQVDALRQPIDNLAESERLLNNELWQYNNQMKRVKDGIPMKLNIVTVKDSDYVSTAENLAEQWKTLGIDCEVVLASAENIQQNFIMPRNYDVLVYRLELGGDGDVYSYWHSSGAKEQGLNLANYNSPEADLALARARTQLNETTRGNTYRDFAQLWINDAPAIALYQSNLYYLKSNAVRAWTGDALTDRSVRFRGANDFTVNVAEVNKTP